MNAMLCLWVQSAADLLAPQSLDVKEAAVEGEVHILLLLLVLPAQAEAEEAMARASRWEEQARASAHRVSDASRDKDQVRREGEEKEVALSAALADERAAFARRLAEAAEATTAEAAQKGVLRARLEEVHPQVVSLVRIHSYRSIS